jgi:preprotein translocase subunit YajC
MFAITQFLLWAQDQAAPAPEGGAGGGGGNPFGPFPFLIMLLVLGYFLMLRPMQKQEKQRQALVAAVKKNDRIVNSGGIVGIVDSIRDNEVILRGGLHITKTSIVQILAPEEEIKDQK